MASFHRFYDLCAPFYDRIFAPALDRARTKGFELAEIAPGHRVLEVGVGTGLTARLYPKGCDVVGVDYSEDMLAVARERIKRERLRTLKELHRMDANQLEFPDESFDVVLGAHFLSATPTPERALQEMKRVCKRDGRIVLINSFKSRKAPVKVAQQLLDPVTRHIGFSVKLSLEDLAATTGLRISLRERVSPILPVETAILRREPAQA